MKSNFPFYVLLAVVVALYGCSTDDDYATSSSAVWQTSLIASKLGGDIVDIEEIDDDDVLTRSLFIGGQTGTRFVKLWDDYDEAQVYKNGTKVGTLKPTSTGGLYSTLTGTLDGTFEVGDELTLYMPSADLDYTGQDGTIGNMSRYFDFMTTTVKVASTEESTVTTEELSFQSRQSYLQFKFRDENNLKLHVKQVVIKAASGMLVAMKSFDGTTTYTDELVINTTMETSTKDYPTDIYVALLNESGKKDSYSFTVLATDGNTYKSKTALSGTYGSTGKLTTSVRATTCASVDVGVQTGITPPESDTPDVSNVTL